MSGASTVRAGTLRATLKWQITSMRLLLPLLIVIQILVAAAFSVGVSMFHGDMTSMVAVYLGTGTATIILVFVGLVVGPQVIAGDKDKGGYDFNRSLPISSSTKAMAWIVVCAIVSIPSAFVALAVASWRLDLDLHVTWRAGASMLLVLACGALLGYAISHAIKTPMTIQLASQVLAFAILGFTPITYPLENLPEWFAVIQLGFPFYHMGTIVRDGLTASVVTHAGVSHVVVALWLVLAVAAIALASRKGR